jgi:hypothetical protein
MNWNFVRRFVEIAGNVDWRKGGKYAGRTGLAGARVIAEEMEALLTRDAPITQEEQEEL